MSSEINEIQNNRIIKIKVESLFGIFDYDIPLNDIGVTILIGVNGSGKSTIFKILHNILKAKFYNIIDVDFKSFEVFFESGDFIKCERTARSVNVDNLSLNLAGNKRLENYDGFRRGFQNVWEQSKILHDFSITVRSINPHKLITAKINEDKNEVWYVVSEITGELKTILDQLVTKSRFIETQRLQLNYTDVDDRRLAYYERNHRAHAVQRKLDGTFVESYEISTTNSRIQEYASDLSQIIKSERSNYFGETQDVEKETLSKYLNKSNVNLQGRALGSEIKDIKNDILKMNEHMSKLLDLGIYKHGEMSHHESETLNSSLEHLINMAEEVFGEDIESSDDINKFLDISLKSSLLKSYAENMRKKLDIFDDLEGKIEIFRTHINNLFRYKEMQVGLDKGFIFKLNYGLEKDRLIDPIDLSSGEQHEVILNYELIFKTEENSVILIDEPEISLHILWQKKFIDNLLDIARKNSLNIIVATHSPDIVNNHRNLVRVLSEI